LAKTDLLTDMVGEFPELQGVMGRYYALNDGEDPLVAQAIADHYRPRFAGDELPSNDVGLIVAMADKLETLVGMFGTGHLPTGDRDPFALRRHALGVTRMLLDKGLAVRVRSLIQSTAAVFPAKVAADLDIDKLETFFPRASHQPAGSRRQAVDPHHGGACCGHRRRMEPDQIPFGCCG